MPVNHALRPDQGHRTLADVLARNLPERAEQRAVVVLDRDGREVSEATYGELDRRVRALAALLQQVVAPGERALVMAPTGLDFLTGFFACAYAGVVGVPVPPPEAGAKQLARLRSIVKDASPAAILTTAGIAGSEAASEFGSAQLIVVSEVDDQLAELWTDPGVSGGDVAFLQYTSGSTAEPKGAMITHANVAANLAAVWQMAHVEPSHELRIVSWLPLFHDMGLLQPLLTFYTGGHLALIPPMEFLLRPAVWLEGMSHYRGEFSCAPNFAYDLCVAKLSESQRAGLDLRSWRAAVNGAEPVRHDTMARFAEAFGPCGFSESAINPAYGLAEGMVYVSGVREPGDVRYLDLDVEALESGRLVPAEGGRRIVGCGRVPANLSVRVVDPGTGLPVEADRPGEVLIAGESIAAGYWQRPEATAAKFGGGWLRTGDLGFVYEGQLFVLGRLDDMIIVDGRNHYPQDIELTVGESHELLDPSRCAAFAYEVDGQTRVGILAETARGVPVDSPEEVTEAVRAAVVAGHQLGAVVRILKPGGLPRTTSGKVQRARSRALFLEW
ncbi:fatty acyl-AMP ligase [Amycolatopsis sp. 195334CR]|uniref:fatty acyl-AMP ligase n=1 Tax=Amycolatopsis sp. 195334CR TaxID=2814588 RepID=UPI001A8D747B|nr:fatty acyl-AMP ligase [Amycolatopsis sp. 195334CR]MBN6039852.1 fatty acyl-AMP ligase [Amycolatopsis sp. 195334CR]